MVGASLWSMPWEDRRIQGSPICSEINYVTFHKINYIIVTLCTAGYIT